MHDNTYSHRAWFCLLKALSATNWNVLSFHTLKIGTRHQAICGGRNILLPVRLLDGIRRSAFAPNLSRVPYRLSPRSLSARISPAETSFVLCQHKCRTKVSRGHCVFLYFPPNQLFCVDSRVTMIYNCISHPLSPGRIDLLFAPLRRFNLLKHFWRFFKDWFSTKQIELLCTVIQRSTAIDGITLVLFCFDFFYAATVFSDSEFHGALFLFNLRKAITGSTVKIVCSYQHIRFLSCLYSFAWRIHSQIAGLLRSLLYHIE
jgi:hypothetical protein